MKTASKLLSMLLLVAMCLSLMGGSAYALSLEPASGDLALGLPEESSTFDLNLGGSAVVPEGSTTLELEKPGTYNGTKNIWNGLYPDLNTAAQNTTDIKLHDDAPASVNDLGGTISRNVIIDLNGKTLTLTAPLAVNANITIKNGTLNGTSMITVGKGYKVTFTDVVTDGSVSGEGESAETKEYVATIGSEKFTSLEKAIEYAAKQSGTVTITVIDDASKLKDYAIPAMPATMSCDAIVLNLGKNCLTGTLEAKVPFTINGGTISGDINANSNVTLNSTEVTGGIVVAGKTLTVNSSKIVVVGLYGGTLVMGSGSEIGSLQLADTGAQNILKVSGGKIKDFTSEGGSAYRAITGGEWYVNDPDSLEYLKNCVADGLTLKGTENPYTVGSGAGIGSGDSGIVTGDFTVYGSPYTKGSGSAVYVLMPYTSSTGNYYWSTVSNPSSTSQISTISSGYCSVISSGSQYKLTLSNSFLDGLSSGTIYLWTGHDGKYTYMGSLTVNGSNGGTIVEPGDVALWPVDSNEWYSGDGMLAFYYRPAIDFSDPAKKGLWIDGWLQDPTNWITNNNNGLLKIGTAILNNLSRGWHTVSVNTVDGVASCQFYVGATLRPVDTDKHVTGSSKNLQFVCSDPIQSVWVGGRQLTDVDYGDYWTLSSSRKTVTLTAKFLNNRTAGETYTIGVVTDNGDKPSCTFQILTTAQASASPKTGDESNLALWAAVLILSGGAAVAVLPRLKKHEN